MKTKTILISVLLLGLAILFVMPVMAGGWATITLEHLPENISVDQDLEVGFMVRQHGVSPLTDLAPRVYAIHAETHNSFRVDAKPKGPAGRYEAQLNFPQAGTWNWSIRAFTMEQPMPPLVVKSTPAEPGKAISIHPQKVWFIGIGLTVTAAASLLLISKRTRGAVILLIAGLIFSVGGFALAESQPPNSTPKDPASLSLIERGEALFLAKGCITCHKHADIALKYDAISGISGPAGSAPDLSHYSTSPEFLRKWLADPKEVKPDTSMPDLELTNEEVESLMAFLIKNPASTALNELPTEPKEICPVTQPQEPPFIPPLPYPPEVPYEGQFWYGTDDLWTMLDVEGTWWGLPYHNHRDEKGHFGQKVFWWNKGYDSQAEPVPEFKVTARRLDGSTQSFETLEATNAYTPEFGLAMLTGVEIPALGCWEFTGSYQGHELSFVVRVVQ
jgi:hypothetical protein